MRSRYLLVFQHSFTEPGHMSVGAINFGTTLGCNKPDALRKIMKTTALQQMQASLVDIRNLRYDIAFLSSTLFHWQYSR